MHSKCHHAKFELDIGILRREFLRLQKKGESLLGISCANSRSRLLTPNTQQRFRCVVAVGGKSKCMLELRNSFLRPVHLHIEQAEMNVCTGKIGALRYYI